MSPSNRHHQYPLKKNTSWQMAFIRDNLPVLGYASWDGFSQVGWGLLVCHVDRPPANTDLNFHSWRFESEFVGVGDIERCLLDLEVPLAETSSLIDAIAQSDSSREIMLLIHSGRLVEALWLRALATTPPDCYQQVCDRWDEFMPEVTIRGTLN